MSLQASCYKFEYLIVLKVEIPHHTWCSGRIRVDVPILNSLDWNINLITKPCCCCFFQVCFCDVDTDEGENTQQFLAKQYGNGNVYFQKCDVRSENDFTGMA